MLRTVITATAALGLAAGCAPDTSAPVKVSALVLNSNGEYAPQEVELRTITDIVGLKGTVADLHGGARIVLDPEDQDLATAETPESFAAALLKGEGHDVKASYIDQGGVLWPADFHTWNMVTTYYSLERAFDYFQNVGNIPAADFKKPVTTYYFPEFVLKQVDKNPMRDNALYFSVMEAFMVLPFDQLQRAPLAINAGIIAHEYSHRVFNLKVYNGAAFPQALSLWSATNPSPGANILKSFDEGLADYHAYGTTCRSTKGCDTRFLGTSFDGAYEQLAAARDLSVTNRCMTATLYNQLYGQGLDEFGQGGKEYQVGTLIASALYQAGENTGQREVLMRAVVAAYNDPDPQKPGLFQLSQQYLNNQSQFTLAVAAGAIISHVTDLRLKEAVCNELMDHLQIPRDSLVGTGNPHLCPASATPGTTCPVLNTRG
ncbi:hypothetical protein HPC49_01460 [Pyxidicoccus fallax]|uniref:Uncharacterized protein n=1 Tax=Pyxidicoccus fallax TaxID=394095 RepID=A0A848LAE0_9BACT|nr:hypothetical protein [Pyxidicoccus fallax]NMO15222.1 hypothetical protein [Pyxidicoccus fallax]NPC76921.1 hypothetical protein [Pyxidicoccus fallax]